THSPPMILATLEKRAWCRRQEVDRWDVSSLTPNRLKFLAQIARRSTNQALQRMPEQLRYPIPVAFLYQTLIDLTDEALDLFDRCLAEAYHRAGRDLKEFRLAVASSTNEKVRLFREIGRVVLDPQVRDADLRRTIYRRIPLAELRAAVEESDRIIRPLDDHYFDLLESRYTYLRQFTPEFIAALAFRSGGDSPLLRAVDRLRQLNTDHRRVLPEETPLEFVPARWRPYVTDNPDPTARRHHFELSVLWELRGALRAGDVRLGGGRAGGRGGAGGGPPVRRSPDLSEPPRAVGRTAGRGLSGDPGPGRRDPASPRPGERVERAPRPGRGPARPGRGRPHGGPRPEGLTPGGGAEAGEHGGAGATHRRAAAVGRAERAGHGGRRLGAFQRRFRACRGDGAAEPGTAAPPLGGAPRPGLQPRPAPHGADLRPDLPEAGLVHELVYPRRDLEGRDDPTGQLPVPPAAEPVLGWRDALLLRRPAVPRLGQGADGHGPAALLRLRQ